MGPWALSGLCRRGSGLGGKLKGQHVPLRTVLYVIQYRVYNFFLGHHIKVQVTNADYRTVRKKCQKPSKNTSKKKNEYL